MGRRIGGTGRASRIGWKTRPSLSRPSQRSEVDGDVQSHETRRLDRRRLQIADAGGAVVLVECKACIRIEQVEEIDACRRLVTSQIQYLRGAEVHEIHAWSVE